MIYLIDTIGTETGMHLYDEAFVKEFAIENVEARVISNFKDIYTIPLIKNFYHSGKCGNVLLLIQSWFNLLRFFISHRNDTFVYQSFGLRFIDIIFLSAICRSKKLFVIIHDAFEITNEDRKLYGIKFKIQKWVYRNWVTKVICHSQQTIDTLHSLCSFSGEIILYPHFRYHFNKSYNISNVGEDVFRSLKTCSKNFLFFGQLRNTKGVDVLIDSFDILKNNKEVNIIVAGSDKGCMMTNLDVPQNVVKILRYIKDDELNFLFAKCDAVLLPYKEIYQSGVLETVIHFEKFAIMSDVPAFNSFLTEYPSFGIIYSPNTGQALANCMMTLSNSNFEYSMEDKEKYERNHDVKLLLRQMKL